MRKQEGDLEQCGKWKISLDAYSFGIGSLEESLENDLVCMNIIDISCMKDRCTGGHR